MTNGRLARLVQSVLIGAAAVGLLHEAVLAQTKFPTKAVEIILPYSAGASNDLAARAVAQYLEGRWSVPVRVLNKAGGNTVPAASEVMRSAPDGHTVYIDGLPQSSMLEVVVKSLPFSILDRTYLGTVGTAPMMLAVAETSPHKTLKDLAAAWKAAPGSMTWASIGGASAIDMVTRRFARAAGVNVAETRPVTARGGAEATVLLAGGHVDFSAGSYSTLGTHITAGRIRPLAIAAPDRISELPNVPTISEAGLQDGEVLNWIGFSGPPNIPPHVVDIWETTLKEVARDPATLKKFEQIGVVPFVRTAKETREMVIRDKKIVEQLWPEFAR